MRRPEKTLLLFTRIGESLFAAQQPSKKRREKTYPHGLKKKRPPGIEGPRPSSRSRRIPSPPPLPPTARRAFPGQPFHRLRQPCCAIAAQHDVNILESANQIDHFPPGQGPTRRHAEMSAARQRPSLVNHALPLPVQKWAASVRRQLHAHASGARHAFQAIHASPSVTCGVSPVSRNRQQSATPVQERCAREARRAPSSRRRRTSISISAEGTAPSALP